MLCSWSGWENPEFGDLTGRVLFKVKKSTCPGYLKCFISGLHMYPPASFMEMNMCSPDLGDHLVTALYAYNCRISWFSYNCVFSFSSQIPIFTQKRIFYLWALLLQQVGKQDAKGILLVLTEYVDVAVTEGIAVSCKYTQSSLVSSNAPNQLVQRLVILYLQSDGVHNKLVYPAAASADLWCLYLPCSPMPMS